MDYEKAKQCRERAALYRKVIEQAERPGGRASQPGWSRTKEILLELIEEFERDAQDTEEDIASRAAWELNWSRPSSR